jgi:hypothetical protein
MLQSSVVPHAATTQQTWSTQNPLAHSGPFAHGSPGFFWPTHWLFWQ